MKTNIRSVNGANDRITFATLTSFANVNHRRHHHHHHRHCRRQVQ